jgi:hypothetical protein
MLAPDCTWGKPITPTRRRRDNHSWLWMLLMLELWLGNIEGES